MTWQEVHRIRVFGDPIETPRPRHRIVNTIAFSDWWDEGCPRGDLKMMDVIKMLFVQTYMPSKADAWKKTIRFHSTHSAAQGRIEGPIRVDIEFIMPRPKNHYGTGRNEGLIKASSPDWPEPVPDKDNLEKTVFDALSPISTRAAEKLRPEQRSDPVYNFSGLWRNDSQVCSGLVEKRYHRHTELPGAIVVVSRLEPANARLVSANQQATG